MPLTRDEKQTLITEYVEHVRRSQAAIITDYRGLTVKDLSGLRRKLRDAGATYQIAKNSLFARALAEAGVTLPAELTTGPTGIAFCLEDPVAPAKILTEFVTANQQANIFAIRGGFMGTRPLNAKQVEALAKLPAREVILAQLLGSLQGPASSLVGTITAPLRDLVYTLQARGEQGAAETAG